MKPHATPDLHGLNVTALAMSKDSKLLALGGADGKLVLWDRGTDIRDDLAIHLGHAVTTIRFAPDDSDDCRWACRGIPRAVESCENGNGEPDVGRQAQSS